MLHWLKRAFAHSTDLDRKIAAKPPRLRVEQLEDRLTPVSTVTDLSQGLTPNDLVKQLVGVGVQISNVQFTGVNGSAGTFSGGQGTIGFDKGIILSSGLASGVIGAASALASTSNGSPGDTDLDALITGTGTTLDACVLEFDFVPQGAKLSFQYVFGSEEYPEFVGSFNDVFAFFLNGQNVALIPGTTTPISINNVNAGLNSQFFVDNYTTGTIAVTLDGFTTVLTISVNVNKGQTNHIKLAIADAVDRILDSDVFIKAGSFSAPKEPEMKVFNPMRFIFNKRTRTYDGVLTLVNIGNDIQPGPVFVIFKRLPNGARLKNADGVTANGKPFMTINKAVIGVGESVKLFIKIRNPLNKPLSLFYQTSNLEFSATPPDGGGEGA
jgi:hypothetical protein